MKEGGWEGLAVRVRGLATHLLTGARLRELSRVAEMHALGRALEDARAIEGAATSATAIEGAARRLVAAHLVTMWRWADERQPLLVPFLEDEDRRSVRALVRGAASGAPPAARLAGLLPTPTLPRRALDELAAQGRPAEVGALLRAWGHPFGDVITEGTAGDLLETECAVDRLWGARAGAALHHGPRVLREAMAMTIDVANAGTALTLSTQRADEHPERFFVPGGRDVTPALFARAIASESRPTPGERLAAAMRLPRLGEAIQDASLGAMPLEDGALRAMLAWARTEARREPTGPAPVLLFLYRLRAQVRDVQLLVWRLALGAPPPAPHQLVAA